jgi:hypothetical protein
MYFFEITDNSTYANDLPFAITKTHLYSILNSDDNVITSYDILRKITILMRFKYKYKKLVY